MEINFRLVLRRNLRYILKITYDEGRNANIVFCFNDVSEDSDLSFDIIDCIYEDMENVLSDYGFGILFRWKEYVNDMDTDYHYKLIYTNEKDK